MDRRQCPDRKIVNNPAPPLSCGELAAIIRQPIRRAQASWTFVIILGLLVGFVLQLPHLEALAWIVAGSLLPIFMWVRQPKPTLPLMALIALQTLAIFGTPILAQNPSLAQYSADEITAAARQIFIYGFALTGGWLLVVRRPTGRQPHSFRIVAGIDPTRPSTLNTAGLLLLGAGTGYQLVMLDGWLDPLFAALPNGIFPITRTLFDLAAIGGCLIGGYAVGSRAMPPGGRLLFWLLLAVICLVRISSTLLSGASGVVAATCIGHFLGARRPPYTFLIIAVAVAAFFNLSKFEMRAKYWQDEDYGPRVGLAGLPSFFAEWAGYSLTLSADDRALSAAEEAAGQRLTDRLDNLQNLLFAQDAVERQTIPLLDGKTYRVIPQLLVPRVFWPEKPRAHEGQAVLNVHFGRQRLEDTFTTYVAWGLLAEAYGNFGAFWGPLFCGGMLGLLIGWAERWVRPYPITSLQAFFFLIIAVNFSLSFEMVASVWITSAFQMTVALAAATLPFSERRPLRPEAGPTASLPA